MITNSSITLYHYTGSEWTRRYFDAANVFIRHTGEQSKGLTVAKQTIIRIPETGVIDVKPGDRAVTGQCEADNPPKGNDTLMIKEVTDNRRGSPNMHHWKLVCE